VYNKKAQSSDRYIIHDSKKRQTHREVRAQSEGSAIADRLAAEENLTGSFLLISTSGSKISPSQL